MRRWSPAVPRRSRSTSSASTHATTHSTTARSRPTSPSSRASIRRLFGICIATVEGAVYEAGDTRAPFTIQSMSKPLTYGLALERLGTDAVRSRIGVEPSGDAFNEISISPAHRNAAQPADQRRGDRLRRPRRRRARRSVRGSARDVRALRRAGARDRRVRLPVGERHRAPQPRNGPPAPQLRRDRPARRRARPAISGSARSRSTAATSP